MASPLPQPPTDLEPIAAGLFDAYRQRTLVAAPTRTIPNFSRPQAEALAERLRELRIAAGHVPAGYKVGFTNAAVRTQFAADGSMAATVYRQTLAAAPRVDAGALLGPRIEPEVVIGIGPDRNVAWAALGFEIVQSHVADWNFGYLDAIADFGLHAALAIGERQPLTERAAERLASMRVRLSCNGHIVEHGGGSDVDGGPVGSLAWLRTDLRRVGRELQPGDVVSTGSMTRVPAIAPGERWTIEATGAELPALVLDID